MQTVPTIGFNVETLHTKRVDLTVWDVGGACQKMREIYFHYYRDANGMIFVIDSNDSERMYEVKEVLDKYLEDELWICTAPILILCNKQDIATSLTPNEIVDILEIEKIKNRSILVLPSWAITGEGLTEGLEWLSKNI